VAPNRDYEQIVHEILAGCLGERCGDNWSSLPYQRLQGPMLRRARHWFPSLPEADL